ncbi:MAG: hypothetical protein AAFR66_17710 [Bacteroidota bacterium]
MNINSWLRFVLLVTILPMVITTTSCVEEKKPEEAIVASTDGSVESSASIPTSTSYPRNTGLDKRVEQVVSYLKSEESPLYDPSSYSPIKWYAVSANADSSQFVVNHEFRAREEDGVYRRFGKQFVMNAAGKVLNMQDPPVDQ